MPATTHETQTTRTAQTQSKAREAFAAHWREYCIEAGALGTFMVSACVFGVLLGHPSSPVNQLLCGIPLLLRAFGGLAMGLTAISIFYSPWGKRSGAHMNPAVTLTFLTLGKVQPWDAFFYVLFQFLGGVGGVLAASFVLGSPLQDAAVHSVATVPGPGGAGVAFGAEFLISMLMMSMVLWVSNSPRWSRYTPLFAGALVTTFITLEAPLSGMSMNPARTFGSALHAGDWTAIWIYFVAPPAAMLLASVLYRLRCGAHAVFCAKFHHHNNQPCIFRCRYGELNVD